MNEQEKVVNLVCFREWGDPLKQLKEKCAEDYPGIKKDFRECYVHLQKLSAIWHRWKLEVKLHTKIAQIHNKIFKAVQNGDLPEGEIKFRQLKTTLSNQELQLFKLRSSINTYLELDAESFFIFSKILMDRVISLTRYFFEGEAEQPSPTQFNDHRKFFLEKEDWAKDPEYANYIRNETYWYKTLLMTPRDKFITHPQVKRFGGVNPHIRGFYFGKDKPPQLVRLQWSGSFKTAPIKEARELKKKYQEKIPGLRKVQDNLYEILEFFINPDNYKVLEEGDRRKVQNLRIKAGEKLPKLELLKENILDFLEFFNSHFNEWLSSEQSDC